MDKAFVPWIILFSLLAFVSFFVWAFVQERRLERERQEYLDSLAEDIREPVIPDTDGIVIVLALFASAALTWLLISD